MNWSMALLQKSDYFFKYMKMALIVSFILLSFSIMATASAQNHIVPPASTDKDFFEKLETSTSPMITNNWVTFIYRGKAKSVEMMGDLTGWGKQGVKLKKLPGKDIHYVSLQVADDARIEYKYLINGNWQLDPLNPNRNDNGVGGMNNFFVMPHYRPSEWASPSDESKHGRIEDLRAEIRGSKRQIRVYLPPDYDSSNEQYPTFYLGDGIEYIERAHINVIADNLIAARRLRPVIIVCIAPLDRMKEYWLNADYVNFLVNLLVPKVDAKYRTIQSPASRAIGGASLGGLISAYTAMRHPEIFGNVLGQSSAFWVNSMQMIHEVEKTFRKPVKWYLEVGRYEPLLNQNRRMRSLLQAKGYKVRYREVHAGHNWTHWRDTIDDGLTYFFPALPN